VIVSEHADPVLIERGVVQIRAPGKATSGDHLAFEMKTHDRSDSLGAYLALTLAPCHTLPNLTLVTHPSRHLLPLLPAPSASVSGPAVVYTYEFILLRLLIFPCACTYPFWNRLDDAWPDTLFV